MLTDDIVLELLNNYSEDEMIERVVLPLYKKRFKGKFLSIEFTGRDKREDGGVDITYYELRADTKAKRYSGVQVKQGAINTGKGANGIAAISIQAQQAFTKPIDDTSDKKSYRLYSYVLLTSGDIQAKARAAIVDQFEHKPIDFVDGKQLCDWIREDFSDEFLALLQLAGREPAEDEDGEDLSPAETVALFVKERFPYDIDDITGTLNTLGSMEAKIVKVLMLQGPGTTFTLAKRLGKRSSMIEDDLGSLLGEGVIGMDEGGYTLNASATEWDRVAAAITRRIRQLKYEETVNIEDVADLLF
jgi:hypothetical protein